MAEEVAQLRADAAAEAERLRTAAQEEAWELHAKLEAEHEKLHDVRRESAAAVTAEQEQARAAQKAQQDAIERKVAERMKEADAICADAGDKMRKTREEAAKTKEEAAKTKEEAALYAAEVRKEAQEEAARLKHAALAEVAELEARQPETPDRRESVFDAVFEAFSPDATGPGPGVVRAQQVAVEAERVQQAAMGTIQAKEEALEQAMQMQEQMQEALMQTGAVQRQEAESLRAEAEESKAQAEKIKAEAVAYAAQMRAEVKAEMAKLRAGTPSQPGTAAGDSAPAPAPAEKEVSVCDATEEETDLPAETDENEPAPSRDRQEVPDEDLTLALMKRKLSTPGTCLLVEAHRADLRAWRRLAVERSGDGSGAAVSAARSSQNQLHFAGSPRSQRRRTTLLDDVASFFTGQEADSNTDEGSSNFGEESEEEEAESGKTHIDPYISATLLRTAAVLGDRAEGSGTEGSASAASSGDDASGTPRRRHRDGDDFIAAMRKFEVAGMTQRTQTLSMGPEDSPVLVWDDLINEAASNRMLLSTTALTCTGAAAERRAREGDKPPPTTRRASSGRTGSSERRVSQRRASQRRAIAVASSQNMLGQLSVAMSSANAVLIQLWDERTKPLPDELLGFAILPLGDDQDGSEASAALLSGAREWIKLRGAGSSAGKEYLVEVSANISQPLTERNIRVGMQCRRGPHWSFGNQDASPSNHATVLGYCAAAGSARGRYPRGRPPPALHALVQWSGTNRCCIYSIGSVPADLDEEDFPGVVPPPRTLESAPSAEVSAADGTPRRSSGPTEAREVWVNGKKVSRGGTTDVMTSLRLGLASLTADETTATLLESLGPPRVFDLGLPSRTSEMEKQRFDLLTQRKSLALARQTERMITMQMRPPTVSEVRGWQRSSREHVSS